MILNIINSWSYNDLKRLNNITGSVLCGVTLSVLRSAYLHLFELDQPACSINFIDNAFICSFPYISISISCMMIMHMGVIDNDFFYSVTFE